jgi:hypothetical protein
MKGVHVLLEEERQRSARYFERMKRNESNLAYIRAKLGVKGRPNRVTLQRIDDLQAFACSWVAYSDAHKERWDREIARQEGRLRNG